MEHICNYGCRRPAIKLFKSGKWGCSASPNSCPGIQAKKKQSLMDTYGVTNVSQIADVLAKKKETWMKNYGVDNPSKAQINKDKIKAAWPEVDRKRKGTMLEKYGVESYNSTDEFKYRRKATWMEKYGVDNPTKNIEILEKVLLKNSQNDYLTKTMIMPSGNERRYQGFENQVILDLLKSGLTENEIVTGQGNVPHIPYSFNGRHHRYYPDIFIPKLNLIIEVKSKYTWMKYKEKNMAKIEATKKMGYNINVVFR
jgi:hypothetical protein